MRKPEDVPTLQGLPMEVPENSVAFQNGAYLTLDEALEACEKLDLTAGIIASMRDIAENPHVKERKTLVDIADPATGKMLRVPDVPMRVLNSPGKIRFPGLPFGAANEVVYRDLLGYSSKQVEELKSKKVI